MKYTYKKKENFKINIYFKINEQKQAELTYEDNSPSLSNKIDFIKPKSLGFKLIMVLSRGLLKGEIRTKKANGFGFAVRFSI